jgi:HAD superfamily hydrolase (TIGR01459 family)
MSAIKLDATSALISRYDVYLIDAWGVLHDGTSLYPGAVQFLQELKNAGKKTVILSNAARRIVTFKQELVGVGIGEDLYTDAITSGELTWQALSNRKTGPLVGIGHRYYYQGPERSRNILETLVLEETKRLKDADFILNTGAEGNQADGSSFEPLLRKAISFEIPMVCANPDQVAIRGGIRGISAGAIAREYEYLGGQVIYFGKPHAAIYQYCFELFSDIERSAFLMIGDGLATDIRGANKANIDSAFLRSGIHETEISLPSVLSLKSLFEKYHATPTYTLKSLEVM